MTSMMVVVSKPVFSKMLNAEGDALGLGDVLSHRRYESRHRSLDQLTPGGALFLVTARPADRLWLVAIFEKPKADERGWQGTGNKTPITDITTLIKKLAFSTGKGIAAKPGKLGMSLQSPRVLTDNDEALLRALADSRPAVNKAGAKKGTTKKATTKKATTKKSAATKSAATKSAATMAATTESHHSTRLLDPSIETAPVSLGGKTVDLTRLVAHYFNGTPPERFLLEAAQGAVEGGVDLLLAVRAALTPMYRKQLDAIVESIRGQKKKSKQDADILARADGGVPGQIRGADGLTESVRRALEHLRAAQKPKPPTLELGPLAESRAGLSICVHAPELADVAAWASASLARRTAIAKAIEKEASAYDLCFETFECHAIPVAVFLHRATKMRMCLIPGGTFQRGFSKQEEKKLRDAADAGGGAEADYENFGVLLENIETMRPSKAMHVGPFLLAQKPSEPVEPKELAALIASHPFRLPSEAEHEHAQRGLAASALNWMDDTLPEESWFKRAFKKGRKNAFGLSALGFNPEVCGDAHSPSHAKAPKDGARKGAGPRTVRGGAGMMYPWQGCGEWHFLLNAFRSSSDDWEYHLSHRAALGIDARPSG